MWETVKEIFFSKSRWSAPVYFVLGVLAGAVVGTRYSFKAQRPRLRISGGSSGGDPPIWSMLITNHPSFLGQRVDGASAKNVRAQIDVLRDPANGYQLFWNHQSGESQATVDPGQTCTLTLFHRDQEQPGYFVADAKGKPVARFREYSTRFRVRLVDHLERVSCFRLPWNMTILAWMDRPVRQMA